MHQAKQAFALPIPASRRHCAWGWLLLACILLPAHAQTPRNTGAQVIIDRAVVLSDSTPRRVTLPALPAGTEIRVTVESHAPRTSHDAAPVQVEILRVAGQNDATGGDLEKATLHSVLLARTPMEDDMVYRSPNGGIYLVALRRIHDSSGPVIARARVEMQPAGAASEAPQVRTLSSSARSAVAIFSAALLWTTLLLCGAPIVRAFRLQKSGEEPPWYG